MYKLVIGKPSPLSGASTKFTTLWVDFDPLELAFGQFFYVVTLPDQKAIGVKREGVYFLAYQSFNDFRDVPRGRVFINEVE